MSNLLRLSLFAVLAVCLGSQLQPLPAGELVATANGSYETFVQTLNPVAYFRFNGDGTDSSVNGLHGTLQGGPTFAAGQPLAGDPGNLAISLDGVNDYSDVTTAGQALANSGQAFSWSGFVNINTTANVPQILAVNTVGGGNRALFRIASNQAADLDDGGVVTNTNVDIVDPDWHHVAYTRGGAGQTGRYYIDGAEATTHTSLWTFATDDVWSIGQEYDGANKGLPGNYFTGLIDEVALFDYELTPGDIAALANINSAAAPVTPEPASLLLFALGTVAVGGSLWRRRTRS